MTTQEIPHINYYDYLYRFKFIYFENYAKNKAMDVCKIMKCH